MSIQQTVLIFAGGPIAVVAVVYAFVYALSGRRNSKRYRPGRPFPFAPVWFLSAPDRTGAAAAKPALTSGGQHGELPAGTPAGPLLAQAADAPANQPAPHGDTGGASDSW